VDAKLDIAILLYKPGEIEQRLVREISRLTPTSHKLHVFDNSNNEKNFSSGWNDLAAAGAAPYIAFLHSDVYPSFGWERPLIAALEKRPDYGAVLPNPAWFHHIGKTFPLSSPPTDGEMEAWASYSRVKMADAHLACAVAVGDCPVFFCVVVRRSDFQSLKGFDERLRFVGNNHELQWRLNSRGLKTVFVHASSVWHKDALSFRKAISMGNFVQNDEGKHWEYWKSKVRSGQAEKWHELTDADRRTFRGTPEFRIGGPPSGAFRIDRKP
jgi:hypothetical protein